MAIRKCYICNKNINATVKNDSYFTDFSVKKIRYAHTECFINKMTVSARSKKTLEWCNEFIEKQREAEKKDDSDKYTIEKIYLFIQETYNISFFPKYFYTKMANIFNGTYKGLTAPMPPEDLLDMWQQKIHTLDKIADNNRKKGNEIVGLGRVNYDIAILLGKYDSYLAWKERQKLALIEENEKRKTDINKVKYEDINRVQKKMENNKVDISSMLDEI